MGEDIQRARAVWEDREEVVLKMREDGLSYEEIAAHFGIVVDKIRIIGERGLKRRALAESADAARSQRDCGATRNIPKKPAFLSQLEGTKNSCVTA